jgi:hypothetical protein
MSKPIDLAKLRSISISAGATPTRTGSPRVLEIEANDAKLDQDVAAYKRLRKDGLQPPEINGSAEREKNFTEKWQVEEAPPTWQVEQARNQGVEVAG